MLRLALLALLSACTGAPETAAEQAPMPPVATREPPPLLEPVTSEGGACGQVTSNLRDLLDGDRIASLSGVRTPGLPGLTELSSTYAHPNGNPPHLQPETPEQERENLAWACTHAPSAAWDGDPSTGWCEGDEGPGNRQVLVVPGLDPHRPVEIISGKVGSPLIRRFSPRPKRVRVSVLAAGSADTLDGPDRKGTIYHDLDRVASHMKVLKDSPEWQPLPLPDPGERADVPYLVAIQVVGFYPGEKRHDACIAEIRNVPEEP